MSQFIEMIKNTTSQRKKIHEIAKVQTGSTPSKNRQEYWYNGNHPWVSAQDMIDKYVEDTIEKVTNAGYATCKVIPAGSVLYVCRGSIGVISINKMDCATNQSICTATCLNNCRNEFLYYSLKYSEKDIKQQGTGTSFKSLNQSSFSSIEIDVPSLDKQNTFIEIAQQADKSKFIGFKSQFIEMFGNPLASVQKYQIRSLFDCCEINPRRPLLNILDSDLVSFVPMSSVNENGFLQDLVDEEYGKVKKGFTYFENNDVLFAKITPCMENGKGAIAHSLTNGIGMGSTEFHVLRPIKNISNPYWLLCLTRMPIFRDMAAKNMSGTGGQKRVGSEYMSNFKVGLPPIDLQIKFAELYQQADKSKYIN